MANDASINRTSSASDTVVPAARKKQNAQGIDLSQQSFFEELLTIGQFKATIPNATSLPPVKPLSSQSKTESDSDKKAASESNKDPAPTDDTSNSAALQAAAAAAQAALPRNQQPTHQNSKERSTEDRGDKPLVKANNKKNGDEQANAKNPGATSSTADAVTKVGDAPANDSTAPLAVDTAATTTVDSNATAEPTSPLKDSEGKVPTGNDLPKQAGQKSRASADSGDGKVNGNSQLASNQTESKSKPGIALKEFDSKNQFVPEQSKTDTTVVLADQPRSKRAERLAQRASDGGASTDDHETTVDPTLALQTTKEPASIETEFTAIASTESNLPASTGVSTTTPTVIAQPIAISGTGAASISSSKSNADSIVGVNSSQAGSSTQAGVSNTTLSGNVASPGRTDQGRSEVARSNSGTQITAYQEGKLVQRVMRGIEQLANGGGQVRLRLHPPELGALQMSLRMEGGQVFAKLEVENTTARDALLNNVQTLKDRMADQGMKVASFEVTVSTDSAGSGLGSSSSQTDGGTGNQSRWENSSSRFAQQNSNRLPAEPTQTERQPNAVWTRTNGSLDLTV